jgi:MFS family permease
MIKSVEEYLDLLKAELNGSDAATIQDALADAEEHLRAALGSLREKQPEIPEEEALRQIIEQYGSPDETASAYKEVERLTSPALKQSVKPLSALDRFFGVYTDHRTWGSLLFMLIAFVTGIIYFTWTVTGLSISIALSIFIFGLPLAILFLLSVKGLALLEGRLVEALLGVRMPRRPLFTQQGLKWQERLKVLVTDKQTWLSLLYLILQMPVGVLYFSLMITLFFFSIGVIIVPIVQWLFGFPTYQINSVGYYLPVSMLLLIQLGGFITLTLTLHLARAIGRLHGGYAKWMLVAE